MVVIAPGDPDHIERPAAFHCSHMGQRKKKNDDGSCAPANDLKLYRYDEEAHEIDVRVAYASEAYPHLLSVHRFKQTDAWAQQFDIAPFEMPAGAPAGQYVLHYFWRADLPLKPPDPLKTPATAAAVAASATHASVCPMPCAPCRVPHVGPGAATATASTSTCYRRRWCCPTRATPSTGSS